MRCPLHGELSIPEALHDIIEHPLVQRLKRLQQMGAYSHIIRSGSAQHSRYQHSLGVCHLAGHDVPIHLPQFEHLPPWHEY